MLMVIKEIPNRILREHYPADAERITSLSMPNLIMVYEDCDFGHYKNLDFVEAPNLMNVSCDSFLSLSGKLPYAKFPELRITGLYFLSNATSLKIFIANKLESLGYGSMIGCPEMEKIILPSVKYLWGACFFNNKKAHTVIMPNLEIALDDCFYRNQEVTEANFKNLVSTGDNFFHDNKKMTVFNAPNLISAGTGCHPLVYKAIEENLKKREK